MFLASRKSLHNLNSALRSSQDMPHLRVLSASLSISSVSAVSNSISSIEASERAALSEELTCYPVRVFRLKDDESSAGARRARLWAAMRLSANQRSLAQAGGRCPVGQAPRAGGGGGSRKVSGKSSDLSVNLELEIMDALSILSLTK